MEWISVKDELPEPDQVVKTKIDDERGCRNEQNLKRVKGVERLWWYPDGSMYVYYTPTHWMSLPEPPKERP